MPNSAASFGEPYVFEVPYTYAAKFDTIDVAADTALEIQPPSGEEWVFTGMMAYGDGVSNGNAALKKGATISTYIMHPSSGLGEGGVDDSALMDCRLFCDNTVYLYLFNHNAFTMPVSYHAFKCDRVGNVGEVISDVFSVGAGVTASIQPPSGEIWMLTAMTCKGSGADSGYWATREPSVRNNHFLVVSNGIGRGNLYYSAQHNIRVFGDNTKYFVTRNADGAAANIYYSGVVWQ